MTEGELSAGTFARGRDDEGAVTELLHEGEREREVCVSILHSVSRAGAAAIGQQPQPVSWDSGSSGLGGEQTSSHVPDPRGWQLSCNSSLARDCSRAVDHFSLPSSHLVGFPAWSGIDSLSFPRASGSLVKQVGPIGWAQ
ncbi:hypothetical protein VTK73DRAFT_3930 [Phialemonium thermophilum]|uniref:Uncharacterized protein n=1 Tax=Phialemonium thermophilum TaxID=223376 RepID=A0ABR3VD11_9PEZI